jgi:hypothetical protein
VVGPKAFVLAVTEVQARARARSRGRVRERWPAVELPVAAAHDLDRLGCDCWWGGGGR